MTDLIDRAAQALFAVSSEPEHGETWETLSEAWKDNLREHVFAVLASIQEPSHAGKTAVWDCLETNARAGNCKPGGMRGNGMPTAFLRMMMEAECKAFAASRKQLRPHQISPGGRG